jgi:hypothetical protein
MYNAGVATRNRGIGSCQDFKTQANLKIYVPIGS